MTDRGMSTYGKAILETKRERAAFSAIIGPAAFDWCTPDNILPLVHPTLRHEIDERTRKINRIARRSGNDPVA